MNITEIISTHQKKIEFGLLIIGFLFILVALVLSFYISTPSVSSMSRWVSISQLLLSTGVIILILTENWRNENFSRFCYKFLFPITVVILAFIAYFSYPLSNQYPSGYAGLYSEFIVALERNNFSLPFSVPLYDPNGIPFAYPPLSFYVAAAIIKFTKISIFDYLNYMPAITATLALLPTYFLTSKLLLSKSRLSYKSLLAISLLVFSPVIYDTHLTAPGIVRGLAYLFSLIGISIFVLCISKRDFRFSGGIGLLFALTIITHLTYAVFFLVSIMVFSISFAEKKDFRLFVNFLVKIIFAAVFFSSWYWAILVLRYGPKILMYALASHGNLGFLNRLNGYFFLADFAQTITSLDSYPGLGFMTSVILVALFYQLTKKRYVLTIWFIAVFFLVGESLRFLALIGIIASADLLSDLVDIGSHKIQNPKLYFVILSFGFSLLILCNYSYFQYEQIPAVLNDNLINATKWIASNTDRDIKYLFITKNYNTYHNEGEWLPFLSNRVPVLPRWGDEWLGTYTENTDRWVRFYACYTPVTDDSEQCILKTLPKNAPALLICANDPEIISLCTGLAQKDNGAIQYQNDDYTIFIPLQNLK